MKPEAFSRRGWYHRCNAMENQDSAVARNTGGISLAVLCDGAGSFSAGGIAAKIVAETVAEYLAREFRSLCGMDGAVARRQLVQKIWQALHRYSLDTGTPERELACTIVAAAMDKTGRGLCFHLGDGMALMVRRGSDSPELVSAPENGLSGSSATYLTMNCDMFDRLRFSRWKAADVRGLCLLTDGAAAHLAKKTPDGWVFRPFFWERRKLAAQLQAENPEDDYSFALICR